ncbi:MAG: hypothetical protein ACE144_07600 [Thermodesulfobacteriota bacterium]
MPEKDPVDLIRGQLSRVETLAGLHPEHEVFKQWHHETKMILEKVFSSKSVHYQTFLALRFQEVSVKAFASPEIDKINAARFKKDLESARNILQSAAKELTLDRTLFKRIQTTPKTVEVTLKGDYFISSGIQEVDLIHAIEAAFEGSGLSPIRGAEMVQKKRALHHRLDQIRSARFGIYDLTTPDQTETLLELGMALGLGTEITLIGKKGLPFPEAVRSLHLLEYETLSDLTEKLRKKIG